MKKHNWYYAVWSFELVRDGKVIESMDIRNALTDEGEKLLCDVVFRNQDVPEAFYLRVCNDELDEADTLGTIQNEPMGNGYAPARLERSISDFPSVEMDEGDWRVVSKVVEFTAVGGDIGPLNTIFLATGPQAEGKLMAFIKLPQERTIIMGDTGRVRMRIKFK